MQFTRLFAVRHAYPDVLDRQRAATVSVMSLAFAAIGALGTIALVLFFPDSVPQQLIGPNVLAAALYLGAYWLVQRGRLRLASHAFLFLTLTVPLLQSAYGLLGAGTIALCFTVSVLSAAFLFSPGWSLGVALLALVEIGISSYARLAGIIALPGATITNNGAIVAVEAGFLLGVVALFAYLLNTSLFDWARSAQRRARQLEATIVISESAAIASNLNTLLREVVDRIREAYGFYHAQVFILDHERRMARLEASTGRAGEALLARGHALPVGSQSIIGQCTANGEPVVVNDVRRSPTHRPNELLPYTLAELALPLFVGDEVIGAIDVQSTTIDAFQPDDVRSLQVMAAQLAAAIDKARLVDELQVRASENERLYEEAQRNLRQIEDLNRRLTREGWADYLRARRASSTLGYTLLGDSIQSEQTWTAPMRQAYQGETGVVIRKDQQAHIAALPLRVRGEVIGVLEIARSGDRPWSESDIQLAEMLVDRLSLAVENARLYEQATQATEREQIVNRIAQNVQEAETVDQVLQSALAELSEVLGASRGIVQITPKGEPSPAALDAGAATSAEA